jgi:cyclic pyranopterin phosphate synthase
LTSVEVNVKIEGRSAVRVTSNVKAKAQTGVEMEALTATVVALLTVWDMVKQYEKDSRGQYPSTAIENIHVLEKTKKNK